MQSVEAALQQWNPVATEFTALVDHRFQQRFHDVAEFAHGHDAGHPRATLERMQVALQADQRLARRRRLPQLHQQTIGMIEQVATFFHEDVDQFRIQAFQIERLLRIFHGRQHVQQRD